MNVYIIFLMHNRYYMYLPAVITNIRAAIIILMLPSGRFIDLPPYASTRIKMD